MIHIVLFQPDIPQNTGNIGRLCAITQCRLHLIHPLGFQINDKQIRRSGMDYWYSLDVHEHESWEDFEKSEHKPDRLWLFTTKTEKSYWDVSYESGDGLLFGKETTGTPEWLHVRIGDAKCVTIPRYNKQLRSLNLSTSVGVATYEALRQTTISPHDLCD